MLTDENLVEINHVLDACGEIRLSDKEVRWLGYKNASVTELDDIYIIAQMVIIKRDKMRTRRSESLDTIIELAAAEGIKLFGEELEKKETVVPLLCGGFSTKAAIEEPESEGGDCDCNTDEFEYYLNRCKEESIRATEAANAAALSRSEAKKSEESAKSDASATASDRQEVRKDAEQVSQDLQQTTQNVSTTNQNAAKTEQDAIATAADRVQTGKDAQTAIEGAQAVEGAVEQTERDVVQTGKDVLAAQQAKSESESARDDASAAKSEAQQAESGANTAKSAAEQSAQLSSQKAQESAESAVESLESANNALATESRINKFIGIMTESEARAIQSLNENSIYAASGMVDMGRARKHTQAVFGVPINEGMWSYPSVPMFNRVTMGCRSVDSFVTGTSKTDFPITHIAGAVINILGEHELSQSMFDFQLPQAPDGTVIYDSTGDARGSGKANLDLKVDVDPKYGDVAADTNEAVARAFEGQVKNGDFRLGDNGDWSVSGDVVIHTDYLEATNSGGSVSCTQTFQAELGKVYRLSLSYTEKVGARLRITLGGIVDFPYITDEGSGAYSVDWTATTTGNVLLVINRGVGDTSTWKVSNVSVKPVTEEVVTNPVDLPLLEYWEEETPDEIFECIQSLSTTFGDTDVPTVLSTRPLSYFQQYDGQFPDPTLQNDRYRCVVWSDLTDEQKRKVAAYMGEKLFMGENGKIVNGRLRARTIRGAGNGDWDSINQAVGDINLNYSNTRRVQPQGIKDSVPWFSETAGADYLTSLSGAVSNKVGNGVFIARDNQSCAYKGRCFAYVVATVPRANQGAYVEGLNEYGAALCSDGKKWYESANVPATLKDCFIGQVGGDIASGQSGHPDGIFYDGIQAGGLNGVIDWRLSAYESDKKEDGSKALSQVVAETYRGISKVGDLSVSGEYLLTYRETVGGLVELPKKCLGSTVECVHSSDGEVTWTKTNPLVNSVTNSVTLPVGGVSVVSFKAFASQAKPTVKKKVLNATDGLLGIFVTQSHDKSVFTEGVADIILKSDASGIVSEQSAPVKFLVDGVIERIKTLQTDMVAPTNGSQAIKVAVYQISENGQMFLGFIANTMTHNGTDWGERDDMLIVTGSNTDGTFNDANDIEQTYHSRMTAISHGWSSNHARFGTQVEGVDL